MRRAFRDRGGHRGGALSYPSDRLFEEIAYVAYHFHWPYDDIVNLDHFERLRWVREIAKIVDRINADAGSGGDTFASTSYG